MNKRRGSRRSCRSPAETPLPLGETHATRLELLLRGTSLGPGRRYPLPRPGAEPLNHCATRRNGRERYSGVSPVATREPAHEEAASQAASPCDGNSQRSSASRPVEASTVGLTATRTPDRTHARWLGAKRGANSPSLISRVTAKRLNTVGGRNSRS